MSRRRRTKGHTSNGRGSLLIDRMFPKPIGKIRLASGTNDAQALSDINDMLTAMCKSVPPRWDILEAVRDKRVKPLHALSLWRLDRMNEVPTADVLPPLQHGYERWLPTLDVSAAYRAQIESTFRKLLALMSEPTVGNLPALLHEHREECRASGHPVGFNRSKAHVQSFVRATLGDDHQLYRAVTKVPTLAVESTPVRRATPFAALQALLARLPEEHAEIAWSLATTGMRPSEYFALAWGRETDRVLVREGKTLAAKRDVPLWHAEWPTTPLRSRSAFEAAWKKHIGSELGIYDLRRSFAVWMEDAGIPRSRRKLYLGHAAGDVTGLYERRELDAWLAEDAARLQAFTKVVPTLVVEAA